MHILWEHGNSYFSIKSQDFKGLASSDKSALELISKEVIGLSVTEEVGKITSGSLRIRDESNVYSRIFRNGMRFDVSWGYAKWNKLFAVSPQAKENPDEVGGLGDRQGLQAIIQKPSGSLGQDGNNTYNVTFYGDEILSPKSKKVYQVGNYRDMITAALGDLDVKDVHVDFSRQTTKLSTKNPKRQWESSFRFLNKLAYEWRAYFHIAYKRNGDKVAVFVDSNKRESQPVKTFLEKTTGSRGGERTFYYNTGDTSNVLSANWSQNVGESGQGDGATIVYINGQAVVQRYQAETQKVRYWKINTDRIKKKFKGLNVVEAAKLTKEFLSTSNFEEVQWAFDPIDTTTAPQGMGFEVGLKSLGDPFLTPLLKCVFKGNWPAALTQGNEPGNPTGFFMQSVVHNIDQSGYFCDCKIADTYSVTGLATGAQSTGI